MEFLQSQETQTSETAWESTPRNSWRHLNSSSPKTESVSSTLEPVVSSTPSNDQELIQARMLLLRQLNQVAEKKSFTDRTMDTLLQSIKHRQKHRKRVYAKVTGLTIIIFFMIWQVREWANFWWIFQIIGGGWVMDQALDKRREAASTLSKLGDPRSVGVLALALQEGGDSKTVEAAEAALLKLLPRVRASDAGSITPAQMRALLGLTGKGMPLTVALLSALEQIGDESALPVVERLQNHENKWIKEAAEQCLPALGKRIENLRQRDTLLRASSAGAPPDQLLRGAMPPSSITRSEELVRPSMGSPTEPDQPAVFQSPPQTS